MRVDLEQLNWISTVLVIISVIITLFPIIFKFRDTISKTRFYKKIKSKTSTYYIWGNKRKFLIFGAILLITSVSIFSISIYQIISPSPTVQNVTVSPVDFIEEERGGISGINDSGVLFLTIDEGQNFLWKRGWGENKKLKKLKIDYATSGTQIMIGMGSTFTSYSLNKTEVIATLEVDTFSIPYKKNEIYYMIIINTGENPFDLFNIKIEEEVSKTQDSSVILFLFGYILLTVSVFLMRKHKKIWRTEKTPPPDLLRKEAKYADRIENIEMELEVHQNMLKNLEDLNLKGDASTNFYRTKKKHYKENVHKLMDEKKVITSEIEGILEKFKRE